jgi:hypothetical protein
MAAALQLLPKWRCLIDAYFGVCEGSIVFDWMCLRKFSSNLTLSVDGSGAAIASGMAMFDRCVFWEV